MNKSKIRKKIGAELRRIRKEKRVTQEQLSDMTGIGRTAITKYELGTIEIGISHYIAICDALGVDYKKVFEDIEI